MNFHSDSQGRWTWECEQKRSVIDYILFSRGLVVEKMQIEDSERKEIGSDHNLLWCEVRPGNLEKVVLQDRYKWRIDGKCDWEEYQDAVMAEFADWDAQLGELNPVSYTHLTLPTIYSV